MLEGPTLQIAANVERGGELARGLRAQREPMMAAAVAHDEIQVGERQYRRLAQLVLPAHLGVADDDFALRQQPVRETAARRFRVEPDAGDVERPRAVAADIQIGFVQRNGIEAQCAEGERVPRQGAGHRGQRQRDAALPVVQAHIGQREVGAQALPAGIDAADADALADAARNDFGDSLRMFLDLRQNPEAQRQHHRGEAEIDHQRGDAGDAQQPAYQAAPRRRDPQLRQRREILLCRRRSASFGLVWLHHPEANSLEPVSK